MSDHNDNHGLITNWQAMADQTNDYSHLVRDLQIIQDRAQRDEQCNGCGYPFDTGQRVYVTQEGLGNVYCSKYCAGRVEEL
jgi:hypothetical protein